MLCRGKVELVQIRGLFLSSLIGSSLGALLHEHWEHKKRRSAGISNPNIDNWYTLAMSNGAIGGKLVGAGGGGFLMFYAADRSHLRQTMAEAGLEEIEAGGKPFDPTLHEAVAQQESTDVPEGHVIRQIRKGYKFRNRLLRPAGVIVAKTPTA